jgi:hypothetical protein
MSSFYQESRLTGSLSATLINSTRLQVEQQKPFGKPIRFTVDVACLAPALPIVAPEGLAGLAMAAFFALAIGTLAIYGLSRQELLPPLVWSGLAVATLLSAVGLAIAVRLRLLKRLVVQTRCAGVPLFVSPVLPEKRGEMDAFLAMVRLRVGEAETKRGFNAEHLRSGELKTIRRLVQENVLAQNAYDGAKRIILAR